MQQSSYNRGAAPVKKWPQYVALGEGRPVFGNYDAIKFILAVMCSLKVRRYYLK